MTIAQKANELQVWANKFAPKNIEYKITIDEDCFDPEEEWGSEMEAFNLDVNGDNMDSLVDTDYIKESLYHMNMGYYYGTNDSQ